MATFPGGIPSLTRPTTGDPTNTGATKDTTIVDAISDEVEAIAAELGTDPAGTAATVKARITALEEWRVDSYGATGDGSTDDISAINDAVYTAGLAGGGVVYFPPGTYLVSTPVLLRANVTLRGAGIDVTIIKGKSGFTGDAIIDYPSGGLANTAITDLTVDGNKSELTGGKNGINNPVSTFFRVERVKVKDARTRGIHLYQSDDAVLRDVVLADNGVGDDGDTGTYCSLAIEGDRVLVSGVTVAGASGIGIALSGASTGVTIESCRVTDPNYIGIALGGSSNTNIAITGCTVTGSVTGPGIDTGNALHVAVTGCVLSDCWAGLVSDAGRYHTYTGCVVEGTTTSHGIDITATSDSVISGCVVSLPTQRGIQVVTGNRVSVTGCTVLNPAVYWSGIQLYDSDGSTVVGCRVADDRGAGAAAAIGIEVAGTSERCLVANCDLTQPPNDDIYADTSSGAKNIAHIAGNGSPEGAIAADIGSTFTRLDGSSGTLLYAKVTGAGDTGWAAQW